jgi:transcriptional regulator with XRE-family HTH domain
MLSITLNSPLEIREAVGSRAKRLRLDHGLTQQILSERSGVSLGSLKRFERTGHASLDAVVKIAFALRVEDELDHLFPARPFQSITDVLERPKRQRGKRS